MHGTASMLRKEVEIKLELDAASLPALKKIPLLRALKPTARRATEVSVYFDTEKHKLCKNGVMLRVRRVGGRHIQTIKATGKSGPFERDEWEAEVPGNKLDLKLANGTALGPLLNNKLRRQLKPLFETRVRRTVYPVANEAKLAFAFTVDRGTISTGARSLPLCEIELELEHGNVDDLFNCS
jgi:inorganic triphosphatase YgiF